MYMHPVTLDISLPNYDVYCIKQATAVNIGNHLAVITISSQNEEAAFPRAEVLLLPLKELRVFTSYLRSIDVTNFMWFKFKFDLPQKLSKSMQRQILQPFATVVGEMGRQTVEVVGHVDPPISRKLIANMTPSAGWLRAKGWDIYMLAQDLKNVADEAWVAKEYAMAAHKYGQATHFWDAALKKHTYIKGLDTKLEAAQWTFDTVCTINQMAALIHANKAPQRLTSLSSTKSWIEDTRMNGVPQYLKALFVYVTGVSEMVVHHVKPAIETFRYALTLCIPEQQPMIQQALVVATSHGASTVSDRAADLATLISTLPQQPLPNPEIKSYVCDVAAAEKYLCRHFGLHTIPDQFTAIIKQGISIRTVAADGSPGKVIALFPTESRRPYTTAEIDLIEVLLHKRLLAFWRASPPSRRGAEEPKLCQVGHVLPEALEYHKNRHQQTVAQYQATAALMSARVAIGNKVWQSTNPRTIGSTSASRDETTRDALLAGWNARTRAQKEKLDGVVQELVRKYYGS